MRPRRSKTRRHRLTLAFVCALGTSLVVRLQLAQRQIVHVLAHRHEVPETFAARIPLETHQKAADYTAAKVRLGRIQFLLSAGVLLAWTIGGGLEWLDRVWRGTDTSLLMAGLFFTLSAFGINALLALPFSIYRQFRLEERFGFNRTTARLFCVDLFKQVLLAAVLGGGLILGVLFLMWESGSLWWFWVWALVTGVALVFVWIFPTLLLPLFYKLTPLSEGTLKERLARLLERVKFPYRGLFVMDGSRRSTHSNAFFAGLGSSRRIVLYDTLVDAMEPPEVEAVLAHELGHAKLRHILKMTLLSMAQNLAGLALLGFLAKQVWFYEGLGMTRPSPHAALLLFLWVSPVFLFLAHPLSSWLERRYEFQADDFGAEHSEKGSLASALMRLYEHNATTLTPDPLYSAFYDSHPPAAIRVGRLAS
ncbi:MAG: M48 family metallopeptidase [Planctomycetota bacterium]|nr:M48 family metallopeptidase [Planctomycetota bacterium]